MSQVTIENVPKSFERQFGKRIDFQSLIGVYWDGMDWCQYDEVIPTKEDVIVYKEFQKKQEASSGKKILESLLGT